MRGGVGQLHLLLLWLHNMHELFLSISFSYSSCVVADKSEVVHSMTVYNISSDFVNVCLQHLLDGQQLVLGSTRDGGYGLIGMQRQHAALFRDMPWGTDRVLHLTLSRARRLGLQTVVVGGLRDIDTYQDFLDWKKSNQDKAWVV